MAGIPHIKEIVLQSGTIDRTNNIFSRYGLASAVTEFAKSNVLSDEKRTKLQMLGTDLLQHELTV